MCEMCAIRDIRTSKYGPGLYLSCAAQTPPRTPLDCRGANTPKMKRFWPCRYWFCRPRRAWLRHWRPRCGVVRALHHTHVKGRPACVFENLPAHWLTLTLNLGVCLLRTCPRTGQP